MPSLPLREPQMRHNNSDYSASLLNRIASFKPNNQDNASEIDSISDVVGGSKGFTNNQCGANSPFNHAQAHSPTLNLQNMNVFLGTK